MHSNYKEMLTNILNEGIINPYFKGLKTVKQLEYLARTDPDKAETEMKTFFSKLYDKFENILAKFGKTLKSYVTKFDKKKFNFYSNMKTTKSIIDKVIKRGKSLSTINDYVRGALVFKDKKDVDEFIKKFRRKSKSIIVGYEFKEKGKDKDYGYYGSHHLDLMFDGIVVELQVMSQKMWNYKHEAHKIYTATRSTDGADDFYKKISKHIFAVANEDKSETYEFLGEELIDFNPENYEEIDLF